MIFHPILCSAYCGMARFSYIRICVDAQDPKRLAHKPVKATLRLEVERVSQDEVEQDAISECGSFSNSSIEGEGREASLSRHLPQASSGVSRGAFSGRPKWSSMDKRRLAHSASANSFEFLRPHVHLVTLVVILSSAMTLTTKFGFA